MKGLGALQGLREAESVRWSCEQDDGSLIVRQCTTGLSPETNGCIASWRYLNHITRRSIIEKVLLMIKETEYVSLHV